MSRSPPRSYSTLYSVLQDDQQQSGNPEPKDISAIAQQEMDQAGTTDYSDRHTLANEGGQKMVYGTERKREYWIGAIRPPLRAFRLFVMRWYFWIFCLVLGFCIGMSIFMWFGLRVGTEGKFRGDLPARPAGAVLAIVKSIDLDEKVLRVNWMVGGRDMDFFINDKAWEVAFNASANVTPDIEYREIRTSNSVNWVIHEPVFGTYELPFRSRDFMYDHYAQSQSYPLDWYSIRAFIVGRDPKDGTICPVSFMQPYGVLTSWEYQVDWQSTDFISQDERKPESKIWMAHFKLKRSLSTRVFSFLIIIINWAITVSVMWLTWCMVVARRKIPRELYSVPITALFAVPPLRQSMPGVPDVGCMIDYLGLIPNIFLIGVCAVLIIWASVLRDTTNLYPLERFGWDYSSIEKPEREGNRTKTTGGTASYPLPA